MTRLRPQMRACLIVAAAVAVAALELFFRRMPDATLLVALTYFAMVAQGCVALAAVAELTKGVWLNPIKARLLGAYPLLLMAALLSLALGAKLDIYRWTEHPNGWLNPRFFLVRNFVVLMAVYFAARKLATAVRLGSVRKNRWAGCYIALFIVSQSLIAFDWIMSLEHPWVSTLFGGYFFIEAFLMGLAVSTFILLFSMRGPAHGLTQTLRDTSNMMFGFSVMWVGFFFAQFLVIWYGNIPEEVGFVLKRVNQPPYAGLSRAVIVTVWIIPFVVLLSGTLKTVPSVMAGIGALILAGLFVEKLVLVLPAAGLNPAVLAVEMVLLLSAFVAVVSQRELVSSQSITPPGSLPALGHDGSMGARGR